MDPRELSVMITSINNYLYSTLSKEDFKCATIFLNELSKSMFATILFGDVCFDRGKKQERPERKHDKENKPAHEHSKENNAKEDRPEN